MGESSGANTDGVLGRQPGGGGDMVDGGTYSQMEGGVSGNRAGGGNLEISNINPSPPAHNNTS